MIDIHTHVLPGVDDGAFDLEEAVQMCEQAARDGYEALVATPHQRTPSWWNCDVEPLLTAFDELRNSISSGLTVHLGAEIRIDNGLLDALEDLDSSGLLPLAGSRYLLLEFSRQGLAGIDPEGLLQELTLGGWMPIFAHPEFIPGLGTDTELLTRMKSAGALFQLTAGVLTGDFGRRYRKLGFRLVELGLIDFVASDGHGTVTRPVGLSAARSELSDNFGADTATRLTLSNPTAVLDKEPLGMNA